MNSLRIIDDPILLDQISVADHLRIEDLIGDRIFEAMKPLILFSDGICYSRGRGRYS